MNTKNSLKKVVLSGLLVLLFAGCGSNGDSGGTEPIVLAPTIYAPTTTINNKTNVTVRGEVNSIVYVNGEKTNIKIGDNGTATVELETKEIGTTTFIILTENSSGQRSEPIKVTINRVTEDITKPVITINGHSTISINKGTAYTDAGATAKDNVDGVVNVNVSGSVDSSKVGTYTLTYTATDKAGNKAIATRKVIVKENAATVDTTAPVITINGHSTISINKGTAYTDAGATAKDNVDGVVKVNVSGSVDSSKVGTYIITYTVTDKAGNKVIATRKVIVKENAATVDTTAPVITINGHSTISINKGTAYKDAGVTAKDNVDGVVKVNVSGSVDSSKVGTYTITYTATDKAGNKAIATRKVIVKENAATVDTTAPVITINGHSTISINKGTAYKDAGATAKDNVDGVVKVNVSGSVDSSKVGTYTITYTATDKAGNKAIATRKVIVKENAATVDTTKPIISILGDNPASVVQNATYKDAGATAKDNVDGVVKVNVSGSVDSSKVGTYTLTYTATDKAGNKATKTREVQVVLPADTTPPVITVTGDNPLKITQGETFSDPGATATDNRDDEVKVTPTGTVDMDTAGSYTITYTATDKVGNKATATRTVEVKSADVVWNVSTVTGFRQALEDAAINGENDKIVLEAGTYNTTSDGIGTFTFNDNEAYNLTIEAAEGLTYKDVILDGNSTTQVFNFNNTKGSTLILKGVSVIQGNGGGIYTNHNIEIEDCNISNNSSGSTYGGGFHASSATVTNSTIANNSAYYYGGGFYASSATVINSTITNNHTDMYDGGGFKASSATVTNSTIANNSSKRYGGGFESGSTTVTNSTIANNSAPYGGGFESGSTTVTNSTIVNNRSYSHFAQGGGFESSSATVTNSTIVNNSTNGDGGGFASVYSRSVVTNSTIANNSAGSSLGKGGGFYSPRGAIVTNSIFTENKAYLGQIFYSNEYYDSYISNNNFIGNKGYIFASGVFVNNIFDNNNNDIILRADSKIYNNYIDYSKINENGHNVIKKHNLQPASVGDVYLNDDNKTLASNSPVIDKGLNPSSATFKTIIDNDTIYNQMVELLTTDMLGNKRIHNGTIDMGAVEYGSSK